ISFTYPPTSYLCPSMLACWPTIFLSYRVSSVALFPTFLFRYIFHASIYTFHHHFSRLMHAYCILASHTPAFNPLRSSFFRLPHFLYIPQNPGFQPRQASHRCQHF
ncbi:unnamed protein product, partial [Pylaiella littoralis]